MTYLDDVIKSLEAEAAFKPGELFRNILSRRQRILSALLKHERHLETGGHSADEIESALEAELLRAVRRLNLTRGESSFIWSQLGYRYSQPHKLPFVPAKTAELVEPVAVPPAKTTKKSAKTTEDPAKTQACGAIRNEYLDQKLFDKEWTRKDLADESGLAPSTIRRYRSGKPSRKDTYVRGELARAFGVNLKNIPQ